MQDGPERASQKCPSMTAATRAPPDPRMSVPGTTWLWSQGFYIQTMSRRALFLAAVGSGFRTWLSDAAAHHSTSPRPPPPRRSPQETIETWLPNTDHRPRVSLATVTANSILGRVWGGTGCSSTSSHDDESTRTTPSPPGSTPPEQNKMEKETQTQAQKDIKPNIYTKYYSF